MFLSRKFFYVFYFCCISVSCFASLNGSLVLGKAEEVFGEEGTVSHEKLSHAVSATETYHLRNYHHLSVEEIVDELGANDREALYLALIPKSDRYTEISRFYRILAYLIPKDKLDKCKSFWDEIYKIDIRGPRFRPASEQNLQRQLIKNLVDLCGGDISIKSLKDRLQTLNQSSCHVAQYRKDDGIGPIDEIIEKHLSQLREINPDF